MDDPNARKPLSTLWGLPVALGALAVYLITMGSGTYPGRSIELIVQHAGLTPFPDTASPLWDVCVRLLALLPFGTLPLRLGVFSAICGFAAVWLIHVVMARTIHNTIEVRTDNAVRARRAALLGGVTASLFLAFCVPFWTVCNRAHVGSFDVMLLLLAAYLLLVYFERERDGTLILLAGLMGAGAAETATFIVVAPIFAVALLHRLWITERLRVTVLIGIALAFVAGLSVYLLAAWRYSHTEAFLLRGFQSPFQVVWGAWRTQYQLITQSIPEYGWLLVAVVTVVPWFAAAMACRRSLNEERDWGFYLLHLIMAALAALLLYNIQPSPWRLLGERRLLVTPYVFAASAFGYLSAYWYLVPASWWGRAETDAREWIQGWGGVILGILLLAAAAVPPFLNFKEADARPAHIVDLYANAVVDAMGDREWLITDGLIDDSLVLAAHQRGRPIHVLNLQMTRNPTYLKYVSHQFASLRLRSLLQVGAIPFLQEWLQTDPDIDRKLAILGLPDLWLAAGRTVVPHQVVFIGTTEPGQLDAARLAADNRAAWERLGPPLRAVQDLKRTDFVGWLSGYFLRQLSMAANNLGVLMEDLKAPDLAFDAYRSARTLTPGNVSALLNQQLMVEGGYAASDAADVKRSFDKLVQTPPRDYSLWTLSRTYGYVRSPHVFAELGWTWALSGYPGMAVSGLKKAIALSDQDSAEPKKALASVYLAQARPSESERIYREVLERTPDDIGALVGLARSASQRGQITEAGELLTRAEKAGALKTAIAFEWAMLHAAAGNLGQARIVLEELVQVQPQLTQAWMILVGVLVEQKDAAGLEEAARQIDKITTPDFFTLYARAQIAVNRNDLTDARRLFDQALSIQRDNRFVLEMLLRLDLMEGKPEAAEEHVRPLLAADPGNAFANHIMGSLQMRQHDYALAEVFLRKSLESQRPPEVLNDLAWALSERREFAEAEQIAREALAATPAFPAAWDTLGVVLMKTGRLDEAQRAFEKSIELRPEDLDTHTHLAELYVKRGDSPRALKLAETLLGREADLSAEQRDKLHEMAHRIRKGAAQ